MRALAVLLALLVCTPAFAQTLEGMVSTKGSQNEVVMQVTVRNQGSAPLEGYVVEFSLVPQGVTAPPRVYREPVPTVPPGRSVKLKVSPGLRARYANSGKKPTVNVDGVEYLFQARLVQQGAAAPSPAAAPRAEARLLDVRVKTPGNGGSVTVIARVRNDGSAAARAVVTCDVEDHFHDAREVEVAPGQTVEVPFQTGLVTSQPLDTVGNSFIVSGYDTSGTIVKADVRVRGL